VSGQTITLMPIASAASPIDRAFAICLDNTQADIEDARCCGNRSRELAP
jgi:hypothetical protein